MSPVMSGLTSLAGVSGCLGKLTVQKFANDLFLTPAPPSGVFDNHLDVA